MSAFKAENSQERREKLSAKILRTYPDRVPVIVEKGNKRAPDLNKTKFLAPLDMTVGAFLQEVKKHLVTKNGASAATETIFLFVSASVMPNASALMSTLYNQHKEDDGFLYISYATENTFGHWQQ